MNEKKSPQTQSVPHFGWDMFFLTGGFLLLFFLLTNGIPLEQLGWIPEMAKKSKYVRLNRILLLAYVIPLIFYYFKNAASFQNLKIVRFVQRIGRLPLPVSVGVLFLLFWGTFITSGFVRTWAVETRAFDLGIFAQAVWNTLHGSFLYSSLKDGICLLGDHFSPLLLLTAPFYRLWPDPRTLLILQSLATSVNILLVARITYKKTNSRSLALLFALMYCFFMPARGPLREDFHPEVLAEPFMLGAFLCLDSGRLIGFFACLFAMILGKENMLGIAFFFGAYAAFFRKERGAGAAIMVLSVFLFWAETRWWIPALTGKPYFYQAFYQSHQSSFLGLGRLWSADSLEYVSKFFGAFSFLSFFHPATLILTLPILFQNLLSAGETFRSFSYHYVVGLTPFVVLSAIHGFVGVRDRFQVMTKNPGRFTALVVFIFFLQTGPTEYFYFRESQKRFSPLKDTIRAEMAKIPTELSVLTHNGLIPQAINRKYIYQMNYNVSPTKVEMALQFKADCVVLFGGSWEPNTASLEESLRGLLAAGYRIDFQKEDFYILFKKGSGTV